MQDSLEDRIYKAGKDKQFRDAIAQFKRSNRAQNAQQNLYDTLEILGASPEEADEFVNLMVDGGE